MDDATPTRLRFVPDRRATGLAAAGLVVAVVVALVAADGPGRLIAAVAAVVLGAYAVGDLVFSPRLTADAQGLVVRSPATRARLPWADVEHVRADTRLRLGLRSTTLEIDAGPVLVVLSRRAIGADPEQAAGLINALRPA
ncbi:PH domain-containing protein [uncultured Jatrophihabitans sp.]|uniref:PH domain-containing protein n=1 Tax=uncultured Jatrophihabitans sp. TaxID=1610747 RepID=UPI0035CBBBCB